MTDTNEWAWWQAALTGTIGPVQEANPQTGYYRQWGADEPVAIWRENGAVIMLQGDKQISGAANQGRIWLQCAKKPVSYGHYTTRVATKMWPGMPEPKPEKKESEPGPAHNSGDLDAYSKMREDILGDVAEAQAFFAKNPVTDKDQADRAQDWGDELNRKSNAADKQRKAENAKWEALIDENDKRWKSIISAAKQEGANLRDLAQQWGRADEDRRKKEAEDAALAQWEAQQAELKRQREEDAARHRADDDGVIPDADELGFDLPPAEPPKPVVTVAKTMLGTGNSGRRTSVKSAPVETATIVDLQAAAAFFAEQAHPELVTLIQKLADKAIKSRSLVPGVQFSWQKTAEMA